MIERDYISDFGKTEDINRLISEKMGSGIMILMYTDRFECCGFKHIDDTAHLLEARIFTENAELKIMRPTMADGFSYRLIDDSKGNNDFIDEIQLLDIAASEGCEYTASGGGKYTLPLENAAKIRIRNYISYDEQGIAQITDFRAAGFLKRGEG
ncbi:MAG: CRISPR-associated protein Csx19 [Huintestinicola sp.]